MTAPHRLFRAPALWTLYALVALFGYVITAIGPSVPLLRDEFHFDFTMSALHISAMALGMVSAGFVAAPVFRRFGIRAGIWFGNLGMLAGVTALVLAPSPWVSLAGLYLSGLCGGAALAAVQAALADFAGPFRGKALLEANVASSLAAVLPPLTLVLGAAAGMGWRVIWPVVLAGLAATFLLGSRPLATLPLTAPAETARGRLPRAVLRGWLLTFTGVAVEWACGFWAASYLMGLPGGSGSLAILGAGLFQVAAVAGRILASRLAVQWGEKRILAGAIAVAALGFPLYWSLVNPILALGGLMLCGLAAATFYPLGASLCIGAAPAQASQASSLTTVASGSAIFLAPLLLGTAADHWGLRSALLAVPVLMAAMLGLLLIRRRP